MKVSYYMNGGHMPEINFRPIGDPQPSKDGQSLVFGGVHCANSTEYKATMEVDFTEALDLIERLKKAIADMPCPTCHRK